MEDVPCLPVDIILIVYSTYSCSVGWAREEDLSPRCKLRPSGRHTEPRRAGAWLYLKRSPPPSPSSQTPYVDLNHRRSYFFLLLPPPSPPSLFDTVSRLTVRLRVGGRDDKDQSLLLLRSQEAIWPLAARLVIVVCFRFLLLK